jgi:hypothetical protein
MPDEVKDTGLGLGDFLASKPESSPEPVSATKDDSAQAKPDVSATKPDDKPQAETKVEKPAPAAKTEAKADPKAAKPAAAPAAPDFKPNWDDDSNPWKAKATEFDKRFRDTQRSWQEQHQANLEMQRQMQILAKKLDGTYDPQRDEPPPPDPQAIRHWGAIEGKAEASYAAAMRTHGQEKVMAALEKYAQLFGQDRSVQERILQSADPVQGAMDAVAAHEFYSTYGPNPTAIIENIRKQLEAELGPKIAEREAKRIQSELANNRSEPKGIGHVQGSSGATSSKKDNAGRAKSLDEILPFGR